MYMHVNMTHVHPPPRHFETFRRSFTPRPSRPRNNQDDIVWGSAAYIMRFSFEVLALENIVSVEGGRHVRTFRRRSCLCTRYCVPGAHRSILHFLRMYVCIHMIRRGHRDTGRAWATPEERRDGAQKKMNTELHTSAIFKRREGVQCFLRPARALLGVLALLFMITINSLVSRLGQ